MIDPNARHARYVILGLLLIAQMGASLIQQGLGALAPFFVSALDLDKAQLGTVFTALSLGSAIFLTPAGILVDRIGERRAIFVSGFFMGLALVAGATVPSYGVLVVAVFLAGVFYSPTTPAGGTAIMSWFTRDRGLAMGIRQTGVPLGAALGGVLFPVLGTHFGYRGAFLVGGLVCILACTIATSLYRENAQMRPEHRRTRTAAAGVIEVVRDPRMVFVTLACMVLVSAQMCMNSFIAVTATNDGLPIAVAAAMFSIGQVAAAAGRIFWGFLSDLAFGGDRTMPILLITLTMALASFAIGMIAPHHTEALFVAVAFLGMSASGWNGLYAAAMAELGGASRAGTVLGVGLTAIFAAGAIAPTLFGALADARGLHLAWVAVAIMGVCGVVPALLARRAIALHPH
jgi:ACS family hexuronate transporter-like MFS transporter